MAQATEDKVYRDYLTEGLRMLTKSNAEITGRGAYFAISYHDLLNPKPEDTRTGDEIKDHILKKLNNKK